MTMTGRSQWNVWGYGAGLALLTMVAGCEGASDTSESLTGSSSSQGVEESSTSGEETGTTDAGDDSSSSTAADTTGAEQDIDIYALQQGQVPPGQTVTIRDVVVTGTGLVGFWVQDGGGGAYSGLWIDAGLEWTDTFTGIVPGARVDVTGTFIEFDMDGAWPDSVSEIVPDVDGVVVLGMAPEPEPVVLDYDELVDPRLAEPWEGVVVGFERRVMVEETDTGFGGWAVTDGAATLELQNSMYRPEPLALGDEFDAMAGVFQYSFGAFKLEPRRESDITPAAPS